MTGIQAHYTPGEFDYTETGLAGVVVIQVAVVSMTGKKSG